MSNKWDHETTAKFIQVYKLYPCLWNFTSPDHKNKQKRDAAFVSIAQEMNIADFGVQDVKNKIKNLRSTYSQEKKKIEDSKKSGSGLDTIYVSNIKWLTEIEEVFMSDLKRKIFETLPISHDADTQESHTEKIPLASTTSITTTSCTPNKTNTSASKFGKAPQTKKRAKLISNAIADLRMLHQEVNSVDNSEEITAFDMFGKTVAMQLKSMSFENGLMAQSRIQNILTEFGIKDHREKIVSRPSHSYKADQQPNYTERMVSHSPFSNYSESSPASILSDSAVNITLDTSINQTTYSPTPSILETEMLQLAERLSEFKSEPNRSTSDIILSAMNAAFVVNKSKN